MRKGQITIFVIVGIVIIILAGLLIFVRSRVVDTPNNADSQVIEFKKSVSAYVTDCLGLVTAEAVKKAGEQGGDLYDIIDPACSSATPATLDKCVWNPRVGLPMGSNGDNFLQFTDDDSNTYFVSYGIKRYVMWKSSYEELSSRTYDSPDYPEPDFSLAAGVMPTHKPFFGELALRKVCDNNGANAANSGLMSNPCGALSYDTFAPHFPPVKNFSVQEQLEFYIETNIGKCAKFDSFMKKGYAFSVGAPNATVTLSTNAVFVSLDYPLNVTRQNNSAPMTFSTSVNMPMKAMFEFAYELLDKDIKDLNYDLSDAKGQEKTFAKNPKWVFKRFPDASPTCVLATSVSDINGQVITPSNFACSKDDVIRLTDTSSGFILQFAVQNRRPVLDKIPFNQMSYGSNTINAKAMDPDDEAVDIRFEGWGTGSLPASMSTVGTSYKTCDTVTPGDGIFEDYLYSPPSRNWNLWTPGSLTNTFGTNEWTDSIEKDFSDLDLNGGMGEPPLVIKVHDSDPESYDFQNLEILCCSSEPSPYWPCP